VPQTPDLHGEGWCEVIASPAPADWREGRRRKDNVLSLLEARRAAFVRIGRRALLTSVLSNGEATADDVRAAVNLPPDVDPRCLGSVPGLLARAGLIRRVDFVMSIRPERHASFIAVWELFDRDGAEAWLAANPPPPDELLFGEPPPTPQKPSEAAPTARSDESSPGITELQGMVSDSTPGPQT